MRGFASEVLGLAERVSRGLLHPALNIHANTFVAPEPPPREKTITLNVFGSRVVLKPVRSEDASSKVRDVMLRGKGLFPDDTLVIHGPPGTGKTSTLFKALEGDIERILNDDILVVYVAPTNQLVREAAYRLLLEYVARSCVNTNDECVERLADVLYSIRMYGSKVQAFQSIDEYNRFKRAIDKFNNAGLKLFDALRRVNSRADARVRFVFTTEWQDFISKISDTPTRRLALTMFIDEASRSAYYKPFISARSYLQYLIDMMEGRKTQRKLPVLDIRGFIVAGDVMQALVDPEEKGELLLYLLEKKLSSEGYTDRALFLKYTKRLPRGTEKPISRGFYEDALESIKECVIVTRILEELVRRDVYHECIGVASRLEGLNPEKTCRKIDELFDRLYDRSSREKCPIGVLNTGEFPSGTTIEETRSKLAAILALLVTRILGNYEVLVEAPYTELRDYTTWMLYKLKAPSSLRVDTVHAVLGGESDIVISMLAKEWQPAHDESSTLYFNQPEVLNVQLSRHRGLIIVIGNVKRLESTSKAILINTKGRGRIAYSARMLNRVANNLVREHVVVEV